MISQKRFWLLLFFSIVVSSFARGADSDLRFDLPEATEDFFHDRQGPYYHQIFKAASTDGLHFTPGGEMIFDKASVPDIIRLPKGRLAIYAVDGARRSRSGLLVAFSDDNGRRWRAGSLQLKRENGLGGGADPEGVLLEDGRLRLYYVNFGRERNPEPRPPGPERENFVLSAVSSDGIHFEEESGIRFQFPQITDPDVVRIGDTWWMYLSQGPRLIATSSRDGLTFRPEGTIRERGSVSNTVPIGSHEWRQFFCDRGIRSAVSEEGLHWKDDEGFRLHAPVGKVICDPAPVQIGSEWLLFYKVGPGFKPPGKPPKR